MTFILKPRSCDKSTKLVLMVSSGPANKVLRYLSFKKKYCLIKFSKHDTNFFSRSRWRKSVSGEENVRVVFVVAEARTFGQQQDLLQEHRMFGDVVQSSVADGHRLLAYKLLMG